GGSQTHRHWLSSARSLALNGTIGWLSKPQILNRANASFLATREVCRKIGWNYDVFAWIDPTYLKNVQWLAGYRHERNAPPAEIELTLLDSYAQPKRVGEVVAALPQCNPALVVAWSYHLLWKRALNINMRTPLTQHHLIQAVKYA
ncbi:hypothetical protein RCH12_003717, partial [Cryobacterium sp. MP_3.1]|uniref:hypothetical protein n=1 Tax=Cryobacterium sp. MP_3.1 TaxID=3071711 RepID=UPI002E0A0A0F|nr:hypothetical protein [Cryobacterium sp. MP_3.1]